MIVKITGVRLGTTLTVFVFTRAETRKRLTTITTTTSTSSSSKSVRITNNNSRPIMFNSIAPLTVVARETFKAAVEVRHCLLGLYQMLQVEDASVDLGY